TSCSSRLRPSGSATIRVATVASTIPDRTITAHRGGSHSTTRHRTDARTPMKRISVVYSTPGPSPVGGTPCTPAIRRSQLGRFRGSATTAHTSSGGASTTTEKLASATRRHRPARPSGPPDDAARPQSHQGALLRGGAGSRDALEGRSGPRREELGHDQLGVAHRRGAGHVSGAPGRRPIDGERGPDRRPVAAGELQSLARDRDQQGGPLLGDVRRQDGAAGRTLEGQHPLIHARERLSDWLRQGRERRSARRPGPEAPDRDRRGRPAAPALDHPEVVHQGDPLDLDLHEHASGRRPGERHALGVDRVPGEEPRVLPREPNAGRDERGRPEHPPSPGLGIEEVVHANSPAERDARALGPDEARDAGVPPPRPGLYRAPRGGEPQPIAREREHERREVRTSSGRGGDVAERPGAEHLQRVPRERDHGEPGPPVGGRTTGADTISAVHTPWQSTLASTPSVHRASQVQTAPPTRAPATTARLALGRLASTNAAHVTSALATGAWLPPATCARNKPRQNSSSPAALTPTERASASPSGTRPRRP